MLMTLGQVKPAAATKVQLYKCPVGKQAVASTLVIATKDDIATVSVYKVKDGDSAGVTNFIQYGLLLNKNTSCFMTIGLAFAENEALVVETDQADVVFTLDGDENAV